MILTLTDTNILLRAIDTGHPHHPVARAAIRRLRADGARLMVTTQNLIELWAVATRPHAQNGLGLNIAIAGTMLHGVEQAYARLPDHSDELYAEWRSLVARFQVSGKQVHDARLVAAMRVHGIRRILTFNVADFARYSDLITAVHPAEAAA